MVSQSLSAPASPEILESPLVADPPVSRWLSIRWALPAMMLIPLISGIGLTGWLAYRSSRAGVTELIQALNGEVSHRIEQRLGDRIGELNLVNNLVVNHFEKGRLSIENPNKMRQEFWDLVQISPVGDGIYYSDSEGNFLIVKRLENDTFSYALRSDATNDQRYIYDLNEQGDVIGEPEIQPYDPRERSWYQATEIAQAPIWSDVYQSFQPPDLTLTRTTPLVAEGTEPEIILGLDVYLQSLSQFLSSLDIGKTGRAFIIERSGKTSGQLVAVSHGLPFELVPTADGDEDVVHLAAVDSPDTLIRETARHLQDTFGGLDQVPERYPLTFRHNGKTHWVDVSSFQDLNLNWLVVVTIPEADFAANINRSAQHTIFMGLAITGAATLISVLLSFWLVRPITRLTRAATNIKQNAYQPDDLVQVTQRPDELGELASLFDDMALVVNSREQGLSEQVANLRSQIAQYDHRSDGQKQSALQVLQRSREFRQAYEQNRPNSERSR